MATKTSGKNAKKASATKKTSAKSSPKKTTTHKPKLAKKVSKSVRKKSTVTKKQTAQDVQNAGENLRNAENHNVLPASDVPGGINEAVVPTTPNNNVLNTPLPEENADVRKD